ncbi:uncharacterized protein LOC128873749 isoform X3 [Hylaeus volcanicus]|nr:uncharacterized protein LOC128873749 isoform X3 [Hylaeus volcanicus]
MQGFGLIFKDTFPRFGINATEGAVIINTNLAFGMLLGLINGPLLRILGYRKLAIIGSLLYCIGVTMTSFARSFPVIMIFYGVFASLGMSTTLSAFSYAVNSYFTTKRGRAMSLALTLISLGPILVPPTTTFLISYYGFQGTILLYGAFSLHSLVGSLLLQPLKWHKVIRNEEKCINEKEKKTGEVKLVADVKNTSFQDDLEWELRNHQRKRKKTISSIDYDSEIESIYGFDILYSPQLMENVSSDEVDIDRYIIDERDDLSKGHLRRKKRSFFKSADTINLGSSFTIFTDVPGSVMRKENLGIFEENDSLLQGNEEKAMVNTGTDCNDKPEKKSVMADILKKVGQIFDLDLLRDPIYVNIMMGMSIAIFAEANFSVLTPFILTDMKLSTEGISAVMSVIAITDLFSRILAPFLGEWLDQPPRIMYLLSLCLLIFFRTLVTFTCGSMMWLVGVGLGVSKGIRSVYMSLVIPDYVPIDRLPNASGIQMIANGIILLTAGPILGKVRDLAGHYTPCIFIMNSVTALTVILWTIEMYIVRRRKLRMQKQFQDKQLAERVL